MLSKRRIAVVLGATLVAYAGHAHAENACNASYERADLLVHAQKTPRLLEARDALRICGGASCKPWMVKECTKWLADVETRIPSIVPSSNETASVAIDGNEITSPLDGRAIDVDPGEHEFVFTTADGRKVTQRVVVREGAKAQAITATFERTAPATTTKPASPIRSEPVAPSSAPRSPNMLRTVGFVTGGVGIGALALGAVFGLSAMSSKDDAQCQGDVCSANGSLADARSQATISTIAFIGGAALVAGGVTLVVLGSRTQQERAHVAVAPNGMILGGTW